MILYGREKSLKSMIMLRLAYSWVYGQKFLTFDTPSTGVNALYLQAEISHPLLHQRAIPMHTNIANKGIALGQLNLWTESFLQLDTTEGLSTLCAELEEVKPEVLIIDPVYKFMSGDIAKPADATRFLQHMDLVQSRYKVAIVLISHARKPGNEVGADNDAASLLGAGVWSAWPDSVIRVTRAGGSQDGVVFKPEALRHAKEEVAPINVAFDRNTVQFYETPDSLS